MPDAVLSALRTAYHKKLCEKALGRRGRSGPYSIADGSSKASTLIADGIAKALGHATTSEPSDPQTTGTLFAEYTKDFLRAAFERLQHLRPGKWIFSTSQAEAGITVFDQYEHLATLQKVLAEHPDLKAALGGDYLITPDIMVARRPVTDDEMNRDSALVRADEAIGALSPLRKANLSSSRDVLHASISCKWTIRSDRAQNPRTEALNLIRNRKGRVPHIAVVTFEPLPSRIASIALGTGDVDCTYHAAMIELAQAVAASKSESQQEALGLLVKGRRLRDISDLPLDLAI